MFRFRLEFLLRHRRQQEDVAKYELANRIRKANEIESRIRDMQERSTNLSAYISGQTGQVVPAVQLAIYKDYIDDLRRRLELSHSELAQAEKRIEEQREILVQASVARKTVERLKEKQREAYEKEQSRKEQILLDEQAALAYARRAHAE